jgi:putative phosphonate catabolism associated alcohol dehydrogenase
MTQTIVFEAPGQPLKLTEIPVPVPQGSELLVRVTCCTLCRSDLHTYAGRRTEPTPLVLGHEIVGRIEAFGPDAPRQDSAGTPAVPGDRISWAIVAGCGECYFCRVDLPQKCERLYKYGHQRLDENRLLGGGLAEQIVLVPGTVWYKVPDEIPDTVAAAANCATATAAALMRYGGAVRDRTVLILGAGVLGVTACAMARAAGAKAVVVIDPLQESRERALQFGATHALPSDPETLTEGIKNITDGRGADLILELAGLAATVQTAISLARIGGTVLLAGTVSPVGTIGIEPEIVVRRMLTIRGVHNYHPHDLKTALDFLAGPGRIYPWENLIAAEYPLDKCDEAFAAAQVHPGVRIAVIP